MFKIVCAWCGKIVKDDLPGAPVTHLICTPCYEREMRILDEKLAKNPPKGNLPAKAKRLRSNT